MKPWPPRIWTPFGVTCAACSAASTNALAQGSQASSPRSSRQAAQVTPNGVQILGGHGFMQDYPVEKFMREGRALGLLWGGIDLAREDAGRELAAVRGHVHLTQEAL